MPSPLLTDGGHPVGIQKSLKIPSHLSPFNFYLSFFLFLFTTSSASATFHCSSLSCYFHPLSRDVASLEAADASEKEVFSSQISSLNIILMERNTGTSWPAALSISVHNLLCILLLHSTWHSDALSTETICGVEQQR